MKATLDNCTPNPELIILAGAKSLSSKSTVLDYCAKNKYIGLSNTRPEIGITGIKLRRLGVGITDITKAILVLSLAKI